MDDMENIVFSNENVTESENNNDEDLYHHSYSRDKYVVPSNPLIRDRLEWFRDQKLGFMIHWGIYSQMGIVESWPVCEEDWTHGPDDWTQDRDEFRRNYFHLNKTFNPIRFNPDQWADIAKEAGFKYLIFTTKHHDGFCMWDTQYTDYKITGVDCPFSTHKYADICKNLFNSFRDRGMAIATYFSKADWHTPFYWAPGFAKPEEYGRNLSYDNKEYPWLWERFRQFTENQILELTTKYGRIDILWLDGGWVSKANGQDIRLGEIVEKARKHQPWLISSDRTVGGEYENYITPEQTIPPNPIDVPWESNITLGNSFSYLYDDTYKDAREIVKILVDVVSKGGNLALNVGPQPDGRLPVGVMKSLKDLGEWMKVNGEAIYATRVVEPYRVDDYGFTRKGNSVYAIKLYESEDVKVEQEIFIPYIGKVTAISILGCEDKVKFSLCDKGIMVTMPERYLNSLEKAPIAISFKVAG